MEPRTARCGLFPRRRFRGVLIGLVGAEPVATISAVRYGPDFGFIGLYIVKPEFRGRGHGFRISE